MQSVTLLSLVLVLQALVLLSLVAFFFQVARQQGRMLLSIDALQLQISDYQRAVTPVPSAGPSGLSLGTAVAGFSLPDLDGKMVAFEEFRGQRVLLVNWSAGCGYCTQIAHLLAGLLPDLEKHGVELVLVAHGDSKANRTLAQEAGLRCTMLIVTDSSKTPEIFSVWGTPVAYLIDEFGQVLLPVAVGSEQVPALAREASLGRPSKAVASTLAKSQIEREGIKAGTLAPAFTLPDLEGQQVSMDYDGGKRTLLVFSDPQCGPCNQLAPQLVSLQKEHQDNGLGVVMISRGDLEENRSKAQLYGFNFPVLLQRSWEVSREYGIFATPVAFLVGEDGVTKADVAEGAEAILALAKIGIAARATVGVR